MNIFTLWENGDFRISTPKNPHIPYKEGLHVIIAPKQIVANAWQDIDLTEATFKLAAATCKVMADSGLAPWFNIQANGNWGLLPGAKTFFHVHVYGRNMTETWGKPILLPEAPQSYQNNPMPESDRLELTAVLETSLTAF